MHVLIIGGYGTFGFGIAKLLSNEPDLTITLAGRNISKAKAAAASLTGAATVKAQTLDRHGDLAQQIETLPDIIIDASGPFQNYGDGLQNNVINYSLAQGCHYLDLADDLDFVERIRDFDIVAKSKGVTLLSGLSTYPVLTAAAASELVQGMDGITSITAGIAPSPKAVMGQSVIKAIASYAGKREVGVLRSGEFEMTHGLTETVRDTICVPGHDPLPNILFSSVEGPDAIILPEYFEGLENLRTFAGPRPESLHRMMITLAWLVRLRLLPSLNWLSKLFHWVQSHIGWGEHRGGMIVRASNDSQTRSWHMIAEGDDGPLTPAIPCAIMVRKWLRGETVKAGARTAIMDITLADYDKEFSVLNIFHGIHDDSAVAANLYENILGTGYYEQAKPLQNLHKIGTGRNFTGRCKITRGTNPLSHLAAAVFCFPKVGDDIPVSVSLTRKGNKELWVRNFNGRKMRSTQEAGTGRQSRLIIERFGPVAVALAVIIKDGRLYLKTKSWSVLGVPMPRALMPGGDVFEHSADNRFNFHVDICAPIIGRIVKYEGWLVETDDEAASL